MIDFHCHIGRISSDKLNEEYGIPKQAGAEFLVRNLKKFADIDMMFATPYATPHVGYAESLEWLLSEVKPYSELLPVPVIHPKAEATSSFLARINSHDIPGIKLHCGSIDFEYSLENTALLKPFFSFAEERNLIIFIHTDKHSCRARDLAPLLEGYDGKIVLLHCCRPEGIELTRYRSVILETSGCDTKDIDLTMRYVPDRVVFGSDFPFLDYEISLERVRNHISQIKQNESDLLRNTI